MMATSRLLTGVIARTFRSVDEAVTVPQFRVLVMLRYQAPMNMSAIADGLGVNASNASRACDKLVAAGLVDRATHEDDRRHLSLSLTDRGREMIDAVMAERASIIDDVVGRMTPAEQRSLAKGLDAFLAAASGAGLAPADGGRDSLIPWLR
jgi:DNA-binding MarR family transcriptional regulator